MKVVCKNISRLITGQYSGACGLTYHDNKYTLLLTIGKTYDVIDEDNANYLLKDDTGVKRPYNKIRFELISDVRDKKIKEILE